MTRRFWAGLVLTLPVFTLEMGAHVFGAHNWVEPSAVELHTIRFRHAGRPLGRLAVLRARLAIAGHAQPEHVHADRDGHRRGVCLQPVRNFRAGIFSGRVSRPRRHAGESTSNLRASSRYWS